MYKLMQRPAVLPTNGGHSIEMSSAVACME